MLRRKNLFCLLSFRGLKEKAGKAVKPGAAIVLSNVPYKVTKITQGGRGRGASWTTATMKNLETQAVIQKKFITDDIVELAELERETVEFSWIDSSTNSYVFMNMQSFEERRVNIEDIDNAEFMKEGQSVNLLKFRDKIIGTDISITIDCEVTSIDETGAGIFATLDTGAKILVPEFVKVGQRIKVNTVEKAYIERS